MEIIIMIINQLKYILSKTIVLKCKREREFSLNHKGYEIYFIQNKYQLQIKRK